MLAREFEDQDVSGWLASEKLDGVHAYWTGSELLTHNGNRINAPEWFTASLPNVALDGELWLGRGLFQSMVSVMRKAGADWSGVRFVVFVAPEAGGRFADRIKIAGTAIARSPVCEISRQVTVKSNAAAWLHFETIAENGGEGIILRDPSSEYQRNRSAAMLKLKAMCVEDAEVVEINGANATCRFDGSDFILRINGKRPMKVGDIVTFSCVGFTYGGIPRHAAFLEVRDYE